MPRLRRVAGLENWHLAGCEASEYQEGPQTILIGVRQSITGQFKFMR